MQVKTRLGVIIVAPQPKAAGGNTLALCGDKIQEGDPGAIDRGYLRRNAQMVHGTTVLLC